MLFFSSSPVWNFEALEHGTWVSVETNITYTLKKSCWVEVLSVKMHHDVGFLVEFVTVNILDTHACFSRLFDVELVGDVEEVWVDESEGVGRVLFYAGAGVENEFDPALSVF